MEVVDHSEAEKWIQEFGETKAGVKGIVDSEVTKIPKMFIHPPHELPQATNKDGHRSHHLLQVPMIDFKGIDESKARRREVIDEIRKAAESWGFFQIVNHGVPYEVMREVLESVGRFHEQPREAKVDWYSVDFRSKSFNYYSNVDLNVSTPAGWRDTILWQLPRLLEDGSNSHPELPQICRREFVEYGRHMIELQEKLSTLMSEALGLQTDYLSNLGCLKSTSLSGHYYPVCPESHLTLGARKHSDSSFLTLVLQDGVGGLQVLHRSNVWVDVPPVEGAIVANLGDLMQITSNDKFKSVEHRVLAPSIEKPRASVACFFGVEDKRKPYGPIKELVSETNPAIYRDNISFGEYLMYYRMKGQDGKSALPHFRLGH